MALQYGATEGYGPLREQIAAFMHSKGVGDLAAEQLIVTTGSQQALDLLGKVLINPGDRVIVEGPTFPATINCFRLYGANLISASVDGQGVDTDALERLIVEHRPKFIYLIPTFGNPSGALLSLARRRAVLEMAVRHQVLVVEDDPYGDLYFGEAPPPSLLALSAEVPGSRALLVHCGSLSKVLSPGLRVGWTGRPARIAGSRHHVQAVQRRAHQHLRPGHRRPLPDGRAPARHVGHGASGLRQTRPGYGARAAGRVRRRDGLCRNPEGGLFFWARLTGAGGKPTDAAAFAQRAINRGVAFVPACLFTAPTPIRPPCVLALPPWVRKKLRRGLGGWRWRWTRKRVRWYQRSTSSRRSKPPWLMATMAFSRTVGLA
jgi:DNA-binding transcriptional MocR family regulator